MKRLIIYTALCSGIIVAGSGCKKYVEVDPPRTSLDRDLVFSDDKTADAAVVGIYSNMNSYNSSFANSNGNFYPSFSADDFKPANSSPSSDEFTENGLTDGNGTISNLWSEPYSLIFNTNSILEGVPRSSSLSPAKASQVIGEAKFLRAFFYFYLVNYFGDVPLVLSTEYKVTTRLPRTSANIVYDTIVNDLLVAQANLSDAYLNTERIRPNKAAATALLARVYLYRGLWDKAEAESAKIINDGRYALINPDNVFLKTSQEAIWQLQGINTVTGIINTWEGYSIIPTNATTPPAYVMYPNFIGSFEAGDKRAASWLKSFTPATGPVVYYPFKYKVRVSATGNPVTEYSMVLRLAEQYLIRAEARAQQNNLVGAKADVDSIRKRAGIPFLATGLSKDQLLLAIEKERKLELFTEWGHRWFDLRRTGRALAVLGPLKTGLTVDDLYYPIPLDAMLTNTTLTQNKGYIK